MVRIEFLDSNFLDVDRYYFEIEVIRNGSSVSKNVEAVLKGNVHEVQYYDTQAQEMVSFYRYDTNVSGLMAADTVIVRVGSTVSGQTLVNNFSTPTQNSTPLGVASPNVSSVQNLAN